MDDQAQTSGSMEHTPPADPAGSAASASPESNVGIAGAPATKPPFRVGLFVQHLCTVVIAVLVIGVIAGFVMGYRPLHREARRNIVDIPAKVEVVWPLAPAPKGATPKTWLPEQFQQQILKMALDQLGDAPAVFSRDPLESVGIALEQSGWFEGRPRVSRVGDNTIRIEGDWRLPAAVVRAGPKDQLLSWSGRLMPPEYDTNTSGLCVILAAASAKPALKDGSPDYRSVWPGDDMAAALELLATVKPLPWSSQVAGIDLTDYAHTQQLTMLTREDTRIVWGGRPSKPLLGETSSASKLDRINEINRRFARIDANKPAIDISGVHAVEINITASAAAGVDDKADKPEKPTRQARSTR